MNKGYRELDDYLRLRDGGICVYCHDAIGVEREHVIPVLYGGRTIHANLVLSCRACNQAKARNLEPFLIIAFRHLVAVGESVEYLTEYFRTVAENELREAEYELLEIEQDLEEAELAIEETLDDLHLLGLESEEALEVLERLGYSTRFGLSTGSLDDYRSPVKRGGPSEGGSYRPAAPLGQDRPTRGRDTQENFRPGERRRYSRAGRMPDLL